MIAAMQERTTTSAPVIPLSAPPAPVVPDGDGWRLEGFAAGNGPAVSGFGPTIGSLHLYWSWVRDVPTFECRNPKRPECKSLASKDGRCLGCGWSPS